MLKRIIAIVFIFVCTSVAWAILGGTIFTRTYSSDAVSQNRVASTWGAPQNQAPPSALFKTIVNRPQETLENGKKVIKTVQEEFVPELPLESSSIDVGLQLEHRQKGLLWYSTYKVAFVGEYGFRNTSEQTVDFSLKFPTSQAIYDSLTFMVDGVAVPISNHNNLAGAAVKLPAGKTARLKLAIVRKG